jgi:hypothetical protein
MNAIFSYVASIGAFLALAGVASAVLSFFNYELRILMWIDRWGDGVAWAIRIGLVVVGLILVAVGKLAGRSTEG